MTARDYLHEIRELRSELRGYQYQLDNIHISYNSIRGIDYSKDQVQSSPTNALESAAWRMLEKQEKITQEIERLTNDINHRIGLIQKLPAKYSTLLMSLYYDNKPLRAVANETGYKYSYLKKIHSEALRAFSDKYNLYDL